MNPEERIRQLEQELQQAIETCAKIDLSHRDLEKQLQQAREELALKLEAKNKALDEAFKHEDKLQSQLSQWQECARELVDCLATIRDRLAMHDGCSRYQIGDSSQIHKADKGLRMFNQLTSTTTKQNEIPKETSSN